jgi:hypothetical protein
MSLEFAGEPVDTGEKRWIDVPVATDADLSEYVVPVCVINGGEGPTLWLQGALHGSEHVGGVALRDFLNEVSPADLEGTIIGVPVANPTAFAAKNRLSPVDSNDVNRRFPGDPGGTFSEILADTLFSLAVEHADFFADFHNGGNEYDVPGFSIYSTTGDEAEQQAKALVVAAGLPYAVGIDREFGGSLTTELAPRGIPAAVIEIGGKGHISDEYYQENRRIFEDLAREVGVMGGSVSHDVEPEFFDELEWIRTPHGGIFETEVDANTEVSEGETIATVSNIKGEVLAEFEAPYDSVVLCVRSYPVARPGDWVIEVTPL